MGAPGLQMLARGPLSYAETAAQRSVDMISFWLQRHEALPGSYDEKRASVGNPYAGLSGIEPTCFNIMGRVPDHVHSIRFFNVIVGIIFACAPGPASRPELLMQCGLPPKPLLLSGDVFRRGPAVFCISA